MDHRQVVGKFFEEKTMQIFNLEVADSLSLPDLVSKDKSFYVEVKSSAYTNGGVIKEHQLNRFDREINAKRFYAFCYHSICKNMEKDYKTEKDLVKNLKMKSLYLFPFSIVKSHYEHSKKRFYQDNSQHKTIYYVQIVESLANKIFCRNPEIWNKLELNPKNYNFLERGIISVITREGKLEDRIKNCFSEFFTDINLNLKSSIKT